MISLKVAVIVLKDLLHWLYATYQLSFYVPSRTHPLKAEQFRDKTFRSYAWYLGNEKNGFLFHVIMPLTS